ncbi:MAG: ROK family protein [Chloroflexi bacterium]|nr:ROK family protein [Chloroflexota bacterium]MCY3583837.1 ROK family protein [Chloroflexota bacterium]MCY3716231.1 ROK family protein [Chloroflexota bacterium]MDE2650440.1 ROK family protein [Chloroflexota bacterium]MXV93201.1 ROK family protein [Chloroflexota bacterium]
MKMLGIDIGGSGIKGAIVDTKKGDFVGERLRIPTPQPSSPKAVAKVVAQLSRHFDWGASIGCTFPAVVKRGITLSAANVDNRWIGTDAAALLGKHTGNPVLILNDADAAGIAEMRFGAGKGVEGLVVILTLGTGIGSSLFMNGELVPNTEFGHLIIRGKDAEARASDRAREEKGLSWQQWGKRLSEYLQYLEALITPDLYIIGGGVSKRYRKFFPHIQCATPIVPARLRNRAGIVGAAIAAAELL